MSAPRLKELVRVYEDKPEKIIEVAALLDMLIQEGKKENATMQPKLVGHCVSALAPNDRVQHAHTYYEAETAHAKKTKHKCTKDQYLEDNG
jgi:hypothetical protein